MRLVILLTTLSTLAACEPCEPAESPLPGQVCEAIPEFSESCEYVECVNQDQFSSHTWDDGGQTFACTWFSAEWNGEVSQVTLQWDTDYNGCWVLTERLANPVCF